MAKNFPNMGKIGRILHLNLYSLFFTLVFIVLFLICLILFIPTYIYRFFVSCVLRKFLRPDLGKLVNTRSAVLATDDPTDKPQWNLCVWLVLEGELNFDQLRDNLYKNIVLKKKAGHDLDLHNPEYQQYYTKWLGFLFWKWEENFDIKEHCRYIRPDEFSDGIGETCSEEDLRQLIKKYTWEPFPPKKSPWEFVCVPNYVGAGNDSKTVLIFRVHHGVCDGYAILHLLMKEVNNISLTEVAKPETFTRSRGASAYHCLNTVVKALHFWITCPFLMMKMVVRTVDRNEWHLPENKMTHPLNTGFSARIPLDYIKEIKNSHHVSFSAVIYAAITGAVRGAMLEQEKKVPEYMSTAVAVPMPGHPFKLRNHFIFSFLQLPLGIDDPVERLHKVERNIRRLKSSPVPLFNFALVPIIGGTLTWYIKLFTKNTYSTILTSNFPGPPQSVQMTGGGGHNKVIDMNFGAGLGEGNVGIGFMMLSYDGGMRIISSFDKAILATDADVDLFNQQIMGQLEILRQSANANQV